MHAPDGLVAVGHAFTQGLDEVAVELGDRVAHGVGDVQRRRAFLDHRFQHAAQEVHVGPVTILGRELDVAAQVAGEAHRLLGLLEHLVRRHPQLLFHVQRGGRDEGVDARTLRPLQRFGRPRDVAVVGARQRADGGFADGLGDRAHRFEIAIAGRRKAGLDHVDAQAFQLPGDTELLFACHRSAGRLFAVAQGGVENDELVGHGVQPLASVGSRTQHWK